MKHYTYFSAPKYFAVLLVAFASLIACSKHSDPTLPHRKQDPALQTALDELQRLNSFTETGLNYTEYSDRLLTAKGNIDVALQGTNDEAAKHRIEEALSCYISAREAWKLKMDSNLENSDVQDAWTMAAKYSKLAREYAFADEVARQQLDAREKEQEQAEKERFEHEKQAEQEQKDSAEWEHQVHQQQAMLQERKARQEQAMQAEKEQQAREKQALKESQAKEAEAKYERLAGEKQKQLAEEAERERLRRFSPEGTVYNLTQISVPLRYGASIIAPGSELKVINKNADGSLHIQKGGLVADVASSLLTNDRDLAASIRSGGKSK